jgi:hypothetical protein
MKKPLVLSKLALIGSIKKNGLRLALVPKTKKKLPPKRDVALTELKNRGAILDALIHEQDDAFEDWSHGKLTDAELRASQARLEPKIKKAYKDFVAEEKRCIARKVLTKKDRKTSR